MNDTSEAMKIWEALRPMIDKEIETQTKSCVRAKKMIVDRPPDGRTVGVSEPYGQTCYIPYNSGLAGSVAGMPLWVYWYFNDASTMIAFTNGDGSGGTFDLDALQAEIRDLRGDVLLISLSADSLLVQMSDVHGDIARLQMTARSLESEIQGISIEGDRLESMIRQTAEAIEMEVTRASAAEGQLSTRITQTADAISAEASRATAAEGQLSTRITQTADAITAEATRASTAEGQLSTRITQTADAIASEATRASTAEGQLSSRITQTADAITSEVTRATTAEGQLGTAISTVSQTAEGLSVRVSSIEQDGVSKVETTTVTIDSGGVEIKTGGTFEVESGNFYINQYGDVTLGVFTTGGADTKVMNDQTGQLMIRGGNYTYTNGAGIVIYDLMPDPEDPDSGNYVVDFTNTSFMASANVTRIKDARITDCYNENLMIKNVYVNVPGTTTYNLSKLCTGASKSGNSLILSFSDGTQFTYP